MLFRGGYSQYMKFTKAIFLTAALTLLNNASAADAGVKETRQPAQAADLPQWPAPFPKTNQLISAGALNTFKDEGKQACALAGKVQAEAIAEGDKTTLAKLRIKFCGAGGEFLFDKQLADVNQQTVANVDFIQALVAASLKRTQDRANQNSAMALLKRIRQDKDAVLEAQLNKIYIESHVISEEDFDTLRKDLTRWENETLKFVVR
jgi:hypothetical protein